MNASTGCSSGCASSSCPLPDQSSIDSQPTVALAGNPNTGKSTVFNALTGLRQHTGNWPGKTVARAEGGFVHQGVRYRLVDLPGTYSLMSASVDEEIARDFLLFQQPDCTVVVVDATALQRNLNLAFQVMEITDKVVVCVNLMDEAARRAIQIDLEKLSSQLGVPVVGTAARRRRGLGALLDAIEGVINGSIRTQPQLPPTPETVREAVETLVPIVRRLAPGLTNPRWVVYRLIEGDQRIRRAVETGEMAGLGADAPASASAADEAESASG